MGEIVDMIICIKNGNEDKFKFLIERFRPVINKYSRKLYKDEREDVESELILALWMSVKNIQFLNSDGEVISYLIKAIYVRFLELYRESCKRYDFEINKNDEIDCLEECCTEAGYMRSIFREDIKNLLSNLEPSKYDIFIRIIIHEKSDREIAAEIHKSRQYVNRVRRQIAQRLKEYFYGEEHDEKEIF